MGLFDFFRRGKKEEKSSSKTKSKKKKDKKKKKKKKKKPKKSLPKTEATIEEWKNLVETVKDHPLSQARVINTEVLSVLTNVLEHIDTKLDKLDKLDQILQLLKASKHELEIQGVDTSKLNLAISEIEAMTVKDKEALNVIEKHGMLNANKLSKELDISRSTASTRLNRLHDKGLVKKVAKGKRIFYKIKTVKSD